MPIPGIDTGSSSGGGGGTVEPEPDPPVVGGGGGGATVDPGDDVTPGENTGTIDEGETGDVYDEPDPPVEDNSGGPEAGSRIPDADTFPEEGDGRTSLIDRVLDVTGGHVVEEGGSASDGEVVGTITLPGAPGVTHEYDVTEGGGIVFDSGEIEDSPNTVTNPETGDRNTVLDPDGPDLIGDAGDNVEDAVPDVPDLPEVPDVPDVPSVPDSGDVSRFAVLGAIVLGLGYFAMQESGA